mmetsp:Transcript_28249/g.39285  ORF Transcript_28249/g.39285 Transcript_28249/m.39285 type:complete len:155 (+) Transcript_28249:209-673(+)
MAKVTIRILYWMPALWRDALFIFTQTKARTILPPKLKSAKAERVWKSSRPILLFRWDIFDAALIFYVVTLLYARIFALLQWLPILYAVSTLSDARATRSFGAVAVSLGAFLSAAFSISSLGNFGLSVIGTAALSFLLCGIRERILSKRDDFIQV